MPVSTANSIACQRTHPKWSGVHAGPVFKRFTPLRRPIYGHSCSQFDVKCQVVFVAAGTRGFVPSRGPGIVPLAEAHDCTGSSRMTCLEKEEGLLENGAAGGRRGEHAWVPRRCRTC